MKFAKFLKTLDKEQKIKVGCKDGNAWWYIGSAGDMLANMDIYDGRAKKSCETYLKNKRRKFNERLANGNPGYYARCTVNGTKFEEDLTPERYMAWLNCWFKSVARLKKNLNRLEFSVKNYIRLDSRNVVDWSEADRTMDEGYLRIVIEGIERGSYWTSDEATTFPACGLVSEDEEDENTKQEDDEVA